MGQNASTEKGSDNANAKKGRLVIDNGDESETCAHRYCRRPPIGNRRTSLELPDINRLSLSPLNPRRAQPTPPVITAPAPAPAPIPIPSHNPHPPVNRDPSPMTPPANDHQDGRQRGASTRADPPYDGAREPMRQPEHHAPTPDAHIHSSIPLGIVLQADGAASTAMDDIPNNLVPTTIEWRGGGGRMVQVSGTFESSWSRRITMTQE